MKIAIEHALGYESLDAQILCDLSSFHSPLPHSHLPPFLSPPLSPSSGAHWVMCPSN